MNPAFALNVVSSFLLSITREELNIANNCLFKGVWKEAAQMKKSALCVQSWVYCYLRPQLIAARQCRGKFHCSHELLKQCNMHTQDPWTCSICLAQVPTSMTTLLWRALLSPSAPGSSAHMEQPTPAHTLQAACAVSSPKPHHEASVLGCAGHRAPQLGHHGPCFKIPWAPWPWAPQQPSSQPSSGAPTYSCWSMTFPSCFRDSVQSDWLKFG